MTEFSHALRGDQRLTKRLTRLAPHTARTRQRAATVPLALAVNDTTTLNYSHRPATTGRGPISNNADKTLGLHLHSLLAFTPPRQPLGLLDVQCWARAGPVKRRARRW